jgi:hypothetical protein
MRSGSCCVECYTLIDSSSSPCLLRVVQHSVWAMVLALARSTSIICCRGVPGLTCVLLHRALLYAGPPGLSWLVGPAVHPS